VPVTHTLANDFVSLIDAINRGVLLVDAAPRSKLTQDIADLVPVVVGELAVEKPVPKGFLRGFLSRKVADGTT
jgi:Flp pilus assembly CpaE family ATPase